jgi:hypothetical protein
VDDNTLPTIFDAACGRLIRLFIAALIVGHLASIQAQEPKGKWKRVFTGEGSIIELNVATPRFEPSHAMRVDFRTTFSKPEKLTSTSDLRYKTRLETIDFKLREKRYRLFETTILDEAGKSLSSYKATIEDDWRVIKPGGVMERLFNAVRVLPPFGTWKVISYRFVEGASLSSNTSELDRLIGTQVRLTPDHAAVGTKICSRPDYEHKDRTKEELARELGIQSIAIEGYFESIAVECPNSGWTPPQSLLIKRSTDDMLMLWDGVFLVLKRDRDSNDSSDVIQMPTLKRRG